MTKVVLVTEALTTGGAETFVLRLAAALMARRCSPTLVVLRGDLVNFPLVQRLASELPVAFFRVPCLRWVMRFDGLLYRIGFKFSANRWLQVLQLRKFLKKIEADVVHAHLLTSDLVTARACEPLGVPWVSTMHGDYLALEVNGGSRAARILDFELAVREVDESVSQMVCITDQQTEQLRRLMPRASSEARISKIYNGYEAPRGSEIADHAPEALSVIPRGAFVIGMVARGIREKGWEVMLAAFQELDLPDAWLVLVGDGDYLSLLRDQVRHPRIVFTGNVVDPLRYIARFDVGCLPSRIPTESLPTVVIEYLALGKPVVATDVGEVAKMINAEGEGSAGLLIELDSVKAMSRQMKLALERIYAAPAERERLQENALIAARKFDMGKCVDAYLAIYRSAQG